MAEIVLSGGDRGKTIEVHIADVIAVHLPENPTTGYRWELQKGHLPQIEFLRSDYQVASGGRVGAGGIRTFHFKAQAAGTGQIQLRLRRSWQPDAEAIEQFAVTLRIV